MHLLHKHPGVPAAAQLEDMAGQGQEHLCVQYLLMQQHKSGPGLLPNMNTTQAYMQAAHPLYKLDDPRPTGQA